MIDTEELLDLWELHDAGELICITTNYGWKKDGTNPMGRGTALEAAKRYPVLPRIYGDICQLHLQKSQAKSQKSNHKINRITLMPVRFIFACNLFCFATKKLDYEKPYLSWKNASCMEQIVYSSKTLARLIEKVASLQDRNIYLPRPGTLNGGLSWKNVKPKIEPILPDNVITIHNENR